MKAILKTAVVILLVTIPASVFIGCQSRVSENNLPNVNSEDKVVVRSDYEIGDETLLYTAKTDELRYIKYKNCITITECLSDNPNITIPASIEELPVVSVEDSAFRDRTALERVTIGPNIVYIGSYAFAGCTSLSTVVMSGSVSEIGGNAFAECRSLSSIIIPASVDYLPSSCFSNCTSLVKVVIESRSASSNSAVREKTDKRTLESAFTGCTTLSAIWIPSDVTEISSNLIGGSRKTVVFSESASAAARFAAYGKLDFGITTRDEFDAAVRKYNPIEQEMMYDQIGRVIKSDKFEIKLKGSEFFAKVGSDTAEEGERFVLITFDITNTANYNSYFDGIFTECLSWSRDANGIMRTYVKRPVLVSESVTGYGVPAGTIESGDTKTCAIVLKISTKSSCVSIQFPNSAEAFYINTKK